MPPALRQTSVDPIVRAFPRERWSDAELVVAAGKGDQQAVRVIWERYARSVQSALYAALGADAAVEDLTQEVFLSFFRRAAQLKEPAALRSYLLGAALRSAAFERRRRGRFARWILVWRTARGAPVQHSNVEGRDALRALWRVLDHLPERARAAFVLKYVEELSTSEVAVALDVSEATAKRAIAQGRDRVALLASREPALVDYLRQQGALEP